MRLADEKPALLQESMKYANIAIQHSPTVVELYTHKAKIFQKGGNAAAALNLTEEARCLDLADRYLNAHSSKYMFKAGEVQKAHDTMLLFSRDMDEEKFNVHEMAQMWFEWHCSRAYLVKGEYRKSLK